MDWLEKVWSWVGKVRDRISDILERFTMREMIWVGGTVLISMWAAFAGTLTKGALLGGLASMGGMLWLITYSDRMSQWIFQNRKFIDICVSLPGLFAPLVLGPTLGFAVMFANLWCTTGLVFFEHWSNMDAEEESAKESDVEMVTCPSPSCGMVFQPT